MEKTSQIFCFILVFIVFIMHKSLKLITGGVNLQLIFFYGVHTPQILSPL